MEPRTPGKGPAKPRLDVRAPTKDVGGLLEHIPVSPTLSSQQEGCRFMSSGGSSQGHLILRYQTNSDITYWLGGGMPSILPVLFLVLQVWGVTESSGC